MNDDKNIGCSIRIEYQATNPPKPTIFGVFRDGNLVAYLTIEQMRDALKRWDEMEAARTE